MYIHLTALARPFTILYFFTNIMFVTKVITFISISLVTYMTKKIDANSIYFL